MSRTMQRLRHVAARGGGFPFKVGGEIVVEVGLSGVPTVQNDEDRAKAALALCTILKG